MESILTEMITAIVTAVIVYIASFRKNKIENESNEINTVKTAISIWQNTSEELKKEISQLLEDMAAIRMENRHLHIAISKLTKALQKFDPELANEINNEINYLKK